MPFLYTTIWIDTDRQGEELAYSIPVEVQYVKQVDKSYGADADGNRGTLLIEYEIMDAYIEAEVLKTLTPELATWAIENATSIFNTSSKYH